MSNTNMWRGTAALRVALAVAALLATGGALFAQGTTGNVYGTVADGQGSALPGATVTLSGPVAPQVFVTDEQGRFRFLGLSPGTYQVRAELEGFGPFEMSALSVNANRNTTLEVALSPNLTETITVEGSGVLLDERKIVTGTAVSQIELEAVPTARDPWALLTQTPGVQTDRINVGGNESGQQSVFVAAGASSDDTTWAVDGVNITDMAAISSPSYFDFAAFEEVQFTTGGSDVSLESSGVTVNIVTKRGTNEWKGNARYLLTDGSWQSTPSISKGDAGRNNVGGVARVQNLSRFIPNSIDEVKEYGLDLGGAIIKDRLWAWGAYGKTEIGNIVGSTGQLDATELENMNLKFNGQLGSSNTATVQYSENDKVKDGRGAGATRAPETTTDQSGVGGKPSDITKVEDTHIFNKNFYLTGMYSFVDGGFQLVPKGGLNTPVYMLADGVYRGSYYFLFNNRDVTQYKLDGSTFLNTGAASHELKFGGSYRLAETSSLFGISGGAISYNCAVFGCSEPVPPGLTGALLWRDSNSIDETKFDAYWAQDTFTVGNLTANIGVRYEKAKGKVLPSSIEGVRFGGITFLPGINSQGFDTDFEFKVAMPRMGVTYALGKEHKTLLRASYSRFAEQYLSGNHTRLSSLGGNSILVTYFYDLNRNGFLDGSEAPTVIPIGAIAFNPLNPTNDRSPNITDRNLEPAKTDELLFGIEHALRPDFAVSAALLYRSVTDISEAQPLVRQAGVVRVAQRSDYIPVTTTVAGQTVTYYRRAPGVTSAGGSFLTNGDREQEAFGLTLGFHKRLANRWMARGHFQFTDWTWKVPNSYFDHVDPTNFGDGAGNVASGDRDGEVVAERSGGSGSKGGMWLHAKWSGSVTGQYQVAPDRPWGFNIGSALNFRQGYPSPTFVTVSGADGTSRAVQLTSKIDSRRNDDVYTIDMRLDKQWELGPVRLGVGADIFNLLNNNTVLQRNRSAGSTSFNFIQETISPRAFRVGVTIGL